MPHSADLAVGAPGLIVYSLGYHDGIVCDLALLHC